MPRLTHWGPWNKISKEIISPEIKEQVDCQTCTNPTKYVIGFWDGKDSHGQIFNCHNLDCELKLNMLRGAVITEQEKVLVKEANEKHGVFMDLIKLKRKELGVTLMKMSKGLGISPSTYSDYEQYRHVVPLEIGDRIEGVFRMEKEIKEATTRTNSQINHIKAQMAQVGTEIKT